MAQRALILDLDGTLADTDCLMPLRQSGQWRDCVKQLPQTKPFLGLSEALAEIRALGIPIGIVTASVSFYAERVLAHHRIPYSCLIAYHDCKPRKPHTAPILKCLNDLAAGAPGSLGVGDARDDADAYLAAGLAAWGAGWSGVLDREATWSRVADRPGEIVDFFRAV